MPSKISLRKIVYGVKWKVIESAIKKMGWLAVFRSASLSLASKLTSTRWWLLKAWIYRSNTEKACRTIYSPRHISLAPSERHFVKLSITKRFSCILTHTKMPTFKVKSWPLPQPAWICAQKYTQSWSFSSTLPLLIDLQTIQIKSKCLSLWGLTQRCTPTLRRSCVQGYGNSG